MAGRPLRPAIPPLSSAGRACGRRPAAGL